MCLIAFQSCSAGTLFFIIIYVQNYRSCSELLENSSKEGLNEQYQILNSTSRNHIAWPFSHDATYVFRARILDRNYRLLSSLMLRKKSMMVWDRNGRNAYHWYFKNIFARDFLWLRCYQCFHFYLALTQKLFRCHSHNPWLFHFLD